MRTMIRMSVAGMAVAASLCVGAPAMAADPVEQFYAGKTIHLVIGFGPGGGYDVYGRVLARYLGRHIPGNPTIVPQNMPGAGSLRSAGWLYTAAAKDGTAIATFARGIAMDALLDPDNRQFDARKFSWLGSVTNEVSVCAFGRTSGIASWNDMLTRTTASAARAWRTMPASTPMWSSGSSAPSSSSSPDIRERPTSCSRSSGAKPPPACAAGRGARSRAAARAAADSGAVKVAVQLGLSPHEDLAGVPLIMDQTKDPTDLAALRLIFSRQTMARPFAAPPGIPPERMQALRAAFDATMRDPEFLDGGDASSTSRCGRSPAARSRPW